jgi:hypothetical protein
MAGPVADALEEAGLLLDCTMLRMVTKEGADLVPLWLPLGTDKDVWCWVRSGWKSRRTATHGVVSIRSSVSSGKFTEVYRRDSQRIRDAAVGVEPPAMPYATTAGEPNSSYTMLTYRQIAEASQNGYFSQDRYILGHNVSSGSNPLVGPDSRFLYAIGSPSLADAYLRGLADVIVGPQEMGNIRRRNDVVALQRRIARFLNCRRGEIVTAIRLGVY